MKKLTFVLILTFLSSCSHHNLRGPASTEEENSYTLFESKFDQYSELVVCIDAPVYPSSPEGKDHMAQGQYIEMLNFYVLYEGEKSPVRLEVLDFSYSEFGGEMEFNLEDGQTFKIPESASLNPFPKFSSDKDEIRVFKKDGFRGLGKNRNCLNDFFSR